MSIRMLLGCLGIPSDLAEAMRRSMASTTELYVGPTKLVRFKDGMCTEGKNLQLTLLAMSDGRFVIQVRAFTDQGEQEGETSYLLKIYSLLSALWIVHSSYFASVLSKDVIDAIYRASKGDQDAIQYLKENGTDFASFPSLQSCADYLVSVLERCRKCGLDLDTSDITDALRSGELTLPETTLRRLGIETPQEEDVRLERERKLTRRVSKTFTKFARFVRPDAVDEAVEGLTTLALELDRTGRIEEEQQLVATSLYLTALGISSVEELNEQSSSEMIRALESGSPQLSKVKTFLGKRFKDSRNLCAIVEDVLRWWDVAETEDDSVEDQQEAELSASRN